MQRFPLAERAVRRGLRAAPGAFRRTWARARARRASENLAALERLMRRLDARPRSAADARALLRGMVADEREYLRRLRRPSASSGARGEEA